MKLFKKFSAAALLLALVMIITSCGTVLRTKNETIYSDGDYTLKAGVYLRIIMQVKGEAVSKVQETLGDSSNATSVDITTQKIDGVVYKDWVKAEIERRSQKYVYVEKEFDNLKLSLSDDDLTSIKNAAQTDYYGNSSYGTEGLGAVYVENGIALTSIEEFYKNASKENKIFLSIYGKDGTSAVAVDDLKKALNENSVLINMLYAATTEQDATTGSSTALSDEDKAELKARLDKYAAQLNSGVEFAKAKADYDAEMQAIEDAKNATDDTSSAATSSNASSAASSSETSSTASSDTSSSASSSGTSSDAASSEAEEETPTPLDENATFFSGSDSLGSGKSTFYDKMKDTTIGKAEVLEYTDEGYYILVLRKDVLADPYYLDTYYDQLVGLLKRDDFKTDVAAKAAASGVKANSWAVRDYDQKKIVIEATSSAS